MSRAIELLVKMNDPKCVSVETLSGGRSDLYKEQIIAAFSQAENEYPFGYHLLSAKYRQDAQARKFISIYIEEWCREFNADNNAVQALNYLVDMIADIPLPSQLKRLKSLRNRYLRSQFSHIQAVERANKAAEEAGLALNGLSARQLRIYELNRLRKSTVCPRCRGTGEIGKVQKRHCPECDGKGRLNGTISHLIQSLGCCEEYFKLHLNAFVVKFEQHCYTEMSNAENLIKARLKMESEQ